MEYTLKSGRVLKIDVSQITQKEWRDFTVPDRGDYTSEDTVIMKSTGLTAEENENLTIEEAKYLLLEIIKAHMEYICDPN